MVPGIFLCGAVENMLGPVKCGSTLAMDQYKVYFSTRLTLVCFMELLLTEFLLFLFMFALMLVCFISELDFVPSALSKFFTFVK